MKLETIVRSAETKSELTKLRREGFIPAVMYHNGKPGKNIAVKDSEYQELVRTVKKGHLSTKRVTLSIGGKDVQAIIKEIQYHPTTYKVLHLDFEELDAGVPVNVKVPIECTGMVDCIGVKLGGAFRQIERFLKVRCMPKDIPDCFTLDVTNLQMGQSLRLSDLAIPNTLRPLMPLKEVAVTIRKR